MVHSERNYRSFIKAFYSQNAIRFQGECANVIPNSTKGMGLPSCSDFHETRPNLIYYLRGS
jgi:hypothetical protein